MPAPAPYLAPAAVDRAAHRRESFDLDGARAVAVSDGAVLASDGAPVLLPADAIDPAAPRQYLGRDADGDLVAVPASAVTRADGAHLVPLRELLGGLAGATADRDRDLAVTAVALERWHASHGRCARCGEATTVASGGWTRHCAACQRDHYPRTDPAIIVAITDGDDRILMAHAATFSARRYSHLAGYVEPGESLEQAVHREVAEESGLRLAALTYVGSQPWPFPASVMVAFEARVDDPTLAIDDDEITDARWVTRRELVDLVARGEIVPAPAGSVARALLERWHGDAAALAQAEAG